MKALIMMFLVVAAMVVYAAPAAAQDTSSLAGIWVFTIETPQGIVTAQATLTVEQDIVLGTMIGPEGEMSISGSWNESSVRIYASANNDLLFTFDGARADGIMSGTTEFAGNTLGRWSARRG